MAPSLPAELEIDLAAIVANWRLLRDRAAPAACGAVVKADAYGLGARAVAPALWRAGCRDFFVVWPDEGLVLRELLPEARILLLAGAPPGTEAECCARGLGPVLNSLEDIARWAPVARMAAPAAPAAWIHVDSGMSRLGLPPDEVTRLAGAPDMLAGVPLAGVMSHLACADEPDHPCNDRQLARFEVARAALAPLGPLPASLANSSGLFLGPAFRFDLARPGAGLYGLRPQAGLADALTPVVRLTSAILQIRTVARNDSVGYGATFVAETPRRLATVPIGYADGYLRSLSNRGRVYLDGRPAPVVGRVSMDLITVDVTDHPEARPGRAVEIIGPHQPVDALADQAGTIGYEILTALGGRYHRRYIGQPSR